MGPKDTYMWPCSVFLLSLSYSFCSYYCRTIHNITSSQALSQGQTLISPSQIFELGFFSPNNYSAVNQYVGIWYKNVFPQKVVWVTNRENLIAVTDSPASLTIGSNGDLNLVDGNKGSAIWSTNIGSPSDNSSVAVLLDNGNLVLGDGMSGRVLWQSFDHPTDTLLPKSGKGFNVKTGERYELTCWKTETDPSLGNFIVGVSALRPPQLFTWNGSNPYWRSGLWNKIKFIGVPQMYPSYLSGFKLKEVVEKGTTTFSFGPYNFTISLNLFISSQGALKLMVKDQSTDNWCTNCEAPNSSCDTYGVCGPFALFKNSESSICNCMKGFVPKSNEEWSKGNWKRGRVGRTKLVFNENNTSSIGDRKDGFWKKGMVKLPEFHEYVQNDDASYCNAWCQSNCSCLAYAYVNGIGCLVWSRGLDDIQEFSSAKVMVHA